MENLSAFHDAVELAVHAAIFTAVALALFHPRANAYFRRSQMQT